MNQIKILIVAGFSLSLIVGCVTITPEAEDVALHTQISTILDDCEKLGPVKARVSLWSVASYDQGYQQVKNNLRDEAYKIYNADTVAIINTDEISSELIAHGIAFKCYE